MMMIAVNGYSRHVHCLHRTLTQQHYDSAISVTVTLLNVNYAPWNVFQTQWRRQNLVRGRI